MRENNGVKWENSSDGSVVTSRGTCPSGASRVDVTVAMRIAECPNMPRFKSFTSGGDFILTYFDD